MPTIERGQTLAAKCQENQKLVDELVRASQDMIEQNHQDIRHTTYDGAAHGVADYETPIKSSDDAKKVHGIGAALCSDIDEFFNSGRIPKP